MSVKNRENWNLQLLLYTCSLLPEQLGFEGFLPYGNLCQAPNLRRKARRIHPLTPLARCMCNKEVSLLNYTWIKKYYVEVIRSVYIGMNVNWRIQASWWAHESKFGFTTKKYHIYIYIYTYMYRCPHRHMNFFSEKMRFPPPAVHHFSFYWNIHVPWLGCLSYIKIKCPKELG